MKINNSTRIGMLSILTSLALLPGCGGDSDDQKTPDIAAVVEVTPEESSSDTIIASMDGKPFLTQETVDSYINQLDKAQEGARIGA